MPPRPPSAKATADGHRRKRRRRRRGRGEPREGAAPREDGDAGTARREARPMPKALIAEDGEADEDEGDEQPGMARGDQPANGERRPRRRGRRGGRRRRGGGRWKTVLPDRSRTNSGRHRLPEVDQRGCRFRRRRVRARAIAGAGRRLRPNRSRSRRRCSPPPMPSPSRLRAHLRRPPKKPRKRPSAPRRGGVRPCARKSVLHEPSASRPNRRPDPSAHHDAPQDARSRSAVARSRQPTHLSRRPRPKSAAPRRAGWWSRRFGSGE